MPNVGGKKYPYTKAGRAAAKKAAKKVAKKPAAKNGKKLTAKQKTLPKFLQDKIAKRG